MNPLNRMINVRRMGTRLLNKEMFTCMMSSSSHNSIVSSPYKNQDIPSISITEFAWSKLEKWPDHVAVECSKSGQKYKYRELRKACKEFGTGLLSELSPGSTVGLIMPNSPEFVIATLGCLEAGLIVSPMNPSYGPDEIRHQVTDSGSKLVLAHPSKVAEVKAACPDIKVLPLGEGSTTIDQVRSKGKGKDLPPPPPSSSIAILPYSSGTTGLPKGVTLTHSNIISNVIQFDHPATRMPLESTKDFQEVNPCVLPFFHIYGFTVGLILYLYKGAKIVAIPKFEPQSFAETLKTQKPTMIHVVPHLIQFLGLHPLITKEMLDRVRMASNGAAPMSPAHAERLLEKKEMILISGYGLTESSPAITACSNAKTDLTSLGHCLSNAELKIVNIENGEIQDPSVSGEVCCRGPQIMQGYHNNEEATKSTLKDGWLHTGDIGYLNEEGKLYLIDRLKELIKVKGFQVAPVELERVLVTHPGVADSGVVGLPDDRTGETPVAFVVSRPGTKKPTDQELINYVSDIVSAPHKRITKVHFIEVIPRNASGKILRRVLKQMSK